MNDRKNDSDTGKKDSGTGKETPPAAEVARADGMTPMVAAGALPDGEGAISLRNIHWVKGAIWALFLGLVYVLQSFFAVIFLTFVFSYIAHNVVDILTGLAGGRRFVRKSAVVLTFVVFIFLFYAAGKFIVPNIINQARVAYQKLAELNLGRKGEFDSIFLRAYGGIRYVFFKASDDYEKELAAYREKREHELDEEGGLAVFRRRALAIREGFRDEWIGRKGVEIFYEKEGGVEYAGAFQAFLEQGVKRDLYLPQRETLRREKEKRMVTEFGRPELEEFKATKPDWDLYLEDRIVKDLVMELDTASDAYADYETEFRHEQTRIEGEAALADLEGTPEWEELFKGYYEELTPRERDYDFEKFIALEKAGTQEEYETIVGDEGFSEEKLLADFQKEKEIQFAAALQETEFASHFDDAALGDTLPEAARFLAGAIEQAWNIGITLIFSVFFSFIIVWDVPRLSRTVRRLEDSRIKHFYREIVPGLVNFGSLMGRAFQAQAVIALINTALTFAAMTIFGVHDSAFLCTIVFICSFIPVAGVFLSSVPICLWALMQPGGGIVLALIMIGAITVIHLIEGTVLNPKVMGDMLKLHPLLVLVILFVGEHFFGVWGLLLGVPVCVYIFRYVILKKADPPGGNAVTAVEPAT